MSCSGAMQPFQDSSTLPGLGVFDVSGDLKFPVCSRRECIDNSASVYMDMSNMFFMPETIVAGVLSIDMLLRMVATGNPIAYLANPGNYVDLLSVMPYLVQMPSDAVPATNPSFLSGAASTPRPTTAPTPLPTTSPSQSPTGNPNTTSSPSVRPTKVPTTFPSSRPTATMSPTAPTNVPTNLPSVLPTNLPSERPTKFPTILPTERPTNFPSERPTKLPSQSPTMTPTQTVAPTAPTKSPSGMPSIAPTAAPTVIPTQPSAMPTNLPTKVPTLGPTAPTKVPTIGPTAPTKTPTDAPTDAPTRWPTSGPTQRPTVALEDLTYVPTDSATLSSNYIFSTADAGWLMFIKFIKVIRVLKLGLHMHEIGVLWRVVWRGGEKLLIPLFFFGIATLIFSLLLYVSDAGTECVVGVSCQDPANYPVNMSSLVGLFTNGTRLIVGADGSAGSFQDFRMSAWFALATLTTVGYGDSLPSTDAATAVTCVLMVLGTVYFAVHLITVGMAFSEEQAIFEFKREPFLLDPIQAKLLKGFEDVKVCGG
jgi:hypothetical protein